MIAGVLEVKKEIPISSPLDSSECEKTGRLQMNRFTKLLSMVPLAGSGSA